MSIRVFDWDKAAQIIVDNNVQNASAGIGDDHDTWGPILRDGKPVDEKKASVYLGSIWAHPCLLTECDFYECWKLNSETPGWDAETYWPDSAMKILAERK